MHFEILVEDQSGKKALDVLVPKILGQSHTFRIKPYRGIGDPQPNLRGKTDPNRRILLDQLPRLLNGYGKTYAAMPPESRATVVVVCDLDDRCLKEFRDELLSVLNACNPKPDAHFCLAIEEGEAWFLGDIPAILAAYPKAKRGVLDAYANDSICGTWEQLADAIYPGGAAKLAKQKKLGYSDIGKEKSKWAESIAPKMDVETNRSPSFRYFREKIRATTL